MNTIALRTYRDGDERVLAEIYTESYKRYNGFIPKDPHQWHNEFVANPHIGKERILVAENENELSGYIAYSHKKSPFWGHVREDGEIYDFCLCRSPRAKRSGDMLVKECLIRSRQEGLSSLHTIMPYLNKTECACLTRYGVSTVKNPKYLGVTIIDIARFLDHRNNFVAGEKKNDICMVFEIFQDFSKRYVTYGEKGAVTVVLDDTGSHERVRIRIGLALLTNILFHIVPLKRKLCSEHISIEPARYTAAVIKKLKQLRITDEWVIPFFDMR